VAEIGDRGGRKSPTVTQAVPACARFPVTFVRDGSADADDKHFLDSSPASLWSARPLHPPP
jgi:hypothetical protein